MNKKLTSSRNHAYKKQRGRCFYCGCLMWQKDSHVFAVMNSISHKEALRFQCTAEHLRAKSEGGSDSRENIVAACLFCNQTRHKRKMPPDPKTYKYIIQNRLLKGKWHPKSQHHLMN